MLTILLGVFLGGYYLGHQPESPDIFASINEGYQQVSQLAETVAAITESQADDPQDPQADERNAQILEDAKAMLVEYTEKKQ